MRRKKLKPLEHFGERIALNIPKEVHNGLREKEKYNEDNSKKKVCINNNKKRKIPIYKKYVQLNKKNDSDTVVKSKGLTNKLGNGKELTRENYRYVTLTINRSIQPLKNVTQKESVNDDKRNSYANEKVRTTSGEKTKSTNVFLVGIS